METLLYVSGWGESTERALQLQVARLWRSENLQNNVGEWKRVPGLISFTRPTPNTGMGVAVNHALKNSTPTAFLEHSLSHKSQLDRTRIAPRLRQDTASLCSPDRGRIALYSPEST